VRSRRRARLFLQALKADCAANREHPVGVADAVRELTISRGVQALTLYRLSSRRPGGFASQVLHRLCQLIFTVDLDPRAQIHSGVVLRHPMCVVVGSGAEVGSGCVLFHGATLGKRVSGSAERRNGMPKLGCDVIVGAHAVLLGPISIGDGAVIGAGSVVVTDVPAGATVVGNPGRVLPA